MNLRDCATMMIMIMLFNMVAEGSAMVGGSMVLSNGVKIEVPYVT